MNEIEKILSGNTQKIYLGKFNILGYRDTGASIRVVLQENELSQPFVVWSTTAISRILEAAKSIFERTDDQYHRMMFWMVEKSHSIEIEIDDQTCFQTKEGKTFSYYPIEFLRAPNLASVKEYLRQIQENEDILEAENLKSLNKVPKPEKNTIVSMINLEPGTYICKRFALSTFRGKNRSILFLEKQ